MNMPPMRQVPHGLEKFEKLEKLIVQLRDYIVEQQLGSIRRIIVMDVTIRDQKELAILIATVNDAIISLNPIFPWNFILTCDANGSIITIFKSNKEEVLKITGLMKQFLDYSKHKTNYLPPTDIREDTILDYLLYLK